MRKISFALLAVAAVVAASLLSITIPAGASPGLVTEDLSGTLAPADLASTLVGGGISISNVTFTGADVAAGTFSGGTGIIGFESGIILGSGDIVNVVGPNAMDDVTTDNAGAGDADLTALSGFQTNDAAVLEFDFVPVGISVSFQYVFASDEYNEFVHSEFNDVFAFFINGVNCATVGSDPVSINTINNGEPFGTTPQENPSLYINNDLEDGGGAIDTEMDGLTVVLTCEGSVNANVTNHMKLAIADASDFILDTNVFLKEGSFVAPTPIPTPTPTPSATATATPSPTPTPTPPLAALPPTGSSPSGDASAIPWLALAAGVIALTSGGLALAYRTRRTR